MAVLATMTIEDFQSVQDMVRDKGEPPWETPFDPRAVFVCHDGKVSDEIETWCEASGIACKAFGARIFRFLVIGDEDHACAIALRFL